MNSLVPNRIAWTPAEEVADVFGVPDAKILHIIRLWADSSPENAALKAWLGLACAQVSSRSSLLEDAAEVDCRRLSPAHVGFFSRAIYVCDRLEALKPHTIQTHVVGSRQKDTTVEIENEKFSSKIRNDFAQEIAIIATDGETHYGRALKVKGRRTTIKLTSPPSNKFEIALVEVLGKASRTLADAAWQTWMRDCMQGSVCPYGSNITTRLLWFETKWQKARRRETLVHNPELPVSPAADRLNPSQTEAHDAIVAAYSGDSACFLIHGPPGTGKTSTIAAAVNTWLLRNDKSCIYCACASNVAAKNIAEGLVKTGMADFKIIVSNEYFQEWHEHLYLQNIRRNLVVSSTLSADVHPDEVANIIGSVRVIILTLSMLSSSNLKENGFFNIYPMQVLLVDEASQIRLDEYPHVFARFNKTLKRTCFFGDGKQLAPYQSAQVPQIQSVFELPHLQVDALFLATQYRMLRRLGEFISKHVYDGRLQSGESVSSEEACVEFVDVANGVEQSAGTSIKNAAEAAEVIHLIATRFAQETSIAVISPYDAQRNLIETSLKEAGLPWEDRCFNVDSYQGQEADVIIVSITRTSKLGFLIEQRRSNVMLTRCRKQMIIITNRAFIERQARQTLFGKLATHLGTECWSSAKGKSVGPATGDEILGQLEDFEMDPGWL